MTVSLTLNPEYAIPGRDCLVTFSVAAASNLVRIWCTDAPLGSSLRAKFESSDVTRILLFEGPSADTWTFRPDKGGVYQLACEEYTKGASSHGGAYLDDPEGYQSETQVGTNSTTISVCTKLTAEIGAQGNAATLVIYVAADTIRQTFVDVHGEQSPRLEEPSTDKARTAARSSSVGTALTNIVGVTIAAGIGTPSTVIDDLITNFNAHRTQAGVHAANDTDNAIAVSYRVPGSPAGVARSANELLTKLTRHMQNDNDGAGLGTASYHSPGGNDRADQANAIIVAGAGENDALGQCLLLADLWRAYEAHRVSTTYHTAADSTNDAQPLGDILDLYVAFLTALQQSSPAAPATANAGAVLAVHSGGFREG